jgi:hypothetical protein
MGLNDRILPLSSSIKEKSKKLPSDTNIPPLGKT